MTKNRRVSTTQKKRIEPATEPAVRRGVLLPRFIVFGGLGSALAGNVGWIIWLFIEAVKEHPLEAIIPPLIGVLVGVSAEVIHHYISLGSSHEATAHAISRTNRRSWIYAVLGVVISALEHAIAHEIDKAPGAFVNGLLTLIPFGAAMALAFWDNPIHDNWLGTDKSIFWLRFLSFWERFIRGGIRGAVAATIAYLFYGFAIFILSKGHAPRELVHSVWGWWVIVGFGIGLSYGFGTRFVVLIPLRGMLLLALILSTAVHYNPESEDRADLTGLIFHSALRQALAGPDLPAGFWLRVFGQTASTGHDRHEEELTAEKRESEGMVLYHWFGCDDVAENGGSNNGANDKTPLCRQLIGDSSSPFVRSWFMILFFAAGLGLSQYGEMRFRPAGYESHPLYNIDCHLAGWLATGLVIIILGIRLFT